LCVVCVCVRERVVPAEVDRWSALVRPAGVADIAAEESGVPFHCPREATLGGTPCQPCSRLPSKEKETSLN
jgi:hypothetical protein